MPAMTEKKRQYMQQYRAQNRQRILEQQRQYKRLNRERIRAQRQHYWLATRDQRLQQSRNYWQIHREKLLEKNRHYRVVNRERLREQRRKHYEAHRERLILTYRQYHVTHRVNILLRIKKYYAINREKILRRSRHEKRTHREQYAIYEERRRARQFHALINDLTAAQWREILEAFHHCCAYCGRHMQRLTKDHVTPYIQQGNNTLWNVVPSCQSCNSRKHTGPPLKPVQPLLLTVAPARKKRTP